jgi:hypothetical protein
VPHAKRLLLENVLHEALGPLTFRKHKLVWHRVVDGIVQAVGLEKSSYGDEAYHLRYGSTPLKIENNVNPPLHKLKVQWKLAEQIRTSKARENLIAALDLDHEMDDAPRSRRLQQVLLKYVVPTLEATRTVESLRRALTNPENAHYTIYVSFPRDEL